MLQPLDRLRRTDERARCSGARRPLRRSSRRSRAKPPSRRPDRLRENIGLRAGRPLVQHDREDLRNDVAGALHDDRVADAHVLARDLVLVVQGGVGDDDAADRHGLELGDRRQRAGASDLDLDRLDDRRRLFGGKLMRGRPARRARHEAEPLLQREVVDLVDDAVDVVAERRPLLLDRAVLRQHFRGRAAELGQGIGRQAEARHRLDGAELGRGDGRARFAPGIGEKLQRPLRGHARIELAQRARREIAGIGEHRLARGRLARIERGEIGVAHVDFAARFEDLRRALEPLRDRFDNARVGGHVLALIAVAARRRLDELAVLVAQAAGQPVDLRLPQRHQAARSRPCRGSGARGRKIPRPPRRRRCCRATASARRWRTLANFSDGAAPTLRLAESASARSGKASSSAV